MTNNNEQPPPPFSSGERDNLLRLAVTGWAEAVNNLEEYFDERAGEPDFADLDFSNSLKPLVEIEAGLKRYASLLPPHGDVHSVFTAASSRLEALVTENPASNALTAGRRD